MSCPNYHNNAIKLLKLFNHATHEGSYIQGFEAASTPELFKISLKLLFNLETLAREATSLHKFIEKSKNLLNEYVENYPDNINFDDLDSFANDRLNYHFLNTYEKVNPKDTYEIIDIYRDTPKSNNLTSLIVDYFNNLKMFCLGLWNVGDFMDYLDEFETDYIDYYSEIIEEEE